MTADEAAAAALGSSSGNATRSKAVERVRAHAIEVAEVLAIFVVDALFLAAWAGFNWLLNQLVFDRVEEGKSFDWKVAQGIIAWTGVGLVALVFVYGLVVAAKRLWNEVRS